MAQVKVQTSAPLAGPGLPPGVPPTAMASPGPLGLQPSVNGTGPAPTPACPAPAGGFVDAPVSATSPGPPQENMANPKEKTPMCLVNELARFNRIQPQYKLLSERGPAHAKIFSVQLALGEQVWEAEGTSIKKAQHSTAAKALEESVLPRPAPRSPKVDINSNPGSITPTVELNGLAMKRGEPAIYRPLDPKPMPNYRANYNFRGMFNQRYHYPVPKFFYVQLSVGSHEFIGEGRTRQAARHSAAMKALQALRNEPIPERPPQNTEDKGESDDSSDASKSEISLVYEIALKKNLCVNFEVLKESGPPHMKSFLTRVTVGEFSAEGEGNSKKLSKKRAAISILQDLKKLPLISAVEKPKTHYKKRTKTILKTGPDYGQGMNPISRLAQIQQAKKEKEPEYVLLSERGMPRRREFIMQVKVNNEVATGTGPNKKVAKRNAAEAMLLQLGYKASTVQQNATEMDNKAWNGQKASFTEATSNNIYQEMEASMKHGSNAPTTGTSSGSCLNYIPSKDMGPCSATLPPGHTPYYSGLASSPSPTATMARELLVNGQSPTTDTSLPMKGTNPGLTCGVSVQPAQQLDYLARIQGFQVQYNDAQSGKDYVTYLTLSPVQMTFHGTGSTLQASHDQAALSALKQLSEQGLDPVDGPVKTSEPCGRKDGH
ncbi:double-stranded RNA-binding protein Staufen homolog 2 isoform X4 [Takifugu rubripes]|uniref:double-stranded RNA-binding protein Staufen homolog 2 isoform X4 n=1 Tax=Takifugu rubripes TaxID=31033 RepID=UPI0005D1FDE0|nr:double-stranded RNA-binding protein Staufen homolog 2 isoform X4 [Takifugu rubripes]XP_056869599.1 double-stranded RNA-binding protein Staufen homolog 2 isoform X2 [Takifugu flavidus]|eukprot:XP_011616799.1 PREDICTED: double-stranded RNA-binding protein Staufen homolog 2 isoform X2 [Takifugu rubripes]